MLQEGMVEQIGARATSIMIVGSYVENLSHDQSDIDLVILCNNPENRKEIKKILSSKSLMHERPSLDCKIFTESEFRRAKTSDQHFFLWSSLQHSICLHGRNISKEIKLNLNLVVNNLWNIIKQIEEVYRLLDSHVQFSGCCFQLYTAVSTMYFVKKLVLKDTPNQETKDVFIQSVFGEEYRVARKMYYRLVSGIGFDSKKSIRIRSKVDESIDSEKYERVKELAEKVLAFLRHVVKQVQQRVDKR